MNLPTFAEYEADARERGFDEIIERWWSADLVLDHHGHPFALEALVVQGEMWLTMGGATRHLCTGDRFTLGRDVAHAERYGAQGAVVWVARRHGDVRPLK
ncbi:MAG TPA: AraC family transcriptional regulator [Burkholderiaceae bacterium]|nr:AraC family transcriptional regulator [Burkholderiaceae bacterium]